MPWLPFFADYQDARHLIGWLNAQNDIAYLLRHNRTRWKAVRQVSHLVDGHYLLWHIPSGPLLRTEPHSNALISDPWKGWEQPPPPEPYSALPGVGYKVEPDLPLVLSPGLFTLDLWTRYQPYNSQEKKRLKMIDVLWEGPDPILRVSAFSWGGDVYGGRKAPSSDARRFWDRLHQWIAHRTIPLGAVQRDDATNPWRFQAFPSALKRLKAGVKYDANGFPLDKEIRAATLPWGKR